MKNYITEFIGTFFLVLVICLSTSSPISASPMAPIAVGVTLMALVYMGFQISGAHYNPAVTLAIHILGKMQVIEMFKYWIAQFAGAITAALTFYLLFKVTMQGPAPHSGFTGDVKPILVELLFTFAIVYVILCVAVAKKTMGNSFYGLTIGGIVMGATFVAAPVSGGAFNPAVGLGPNIVDMIFGNGGLSDAWIYILGPLAGAAIATMVFKTTHEPVEY